MSATQMADRCPGSIALGAARLDGYRFRINTHGSANIVPDAMSDVYGVLWQCVPRDFTTLDRYEGVRVRNYLRRYVVEKIAPDTSNVLLCPMPGLVTAIHVSEGDVVRAGDSLCVVEAMKMENILRAERNATVSAIRAAAGESLPVDAVILEFSPE